MPLRADILNPISGSNPSGESLRYAPVYDQIKEARREEIDVTQGIWETEVKRADPALVIKLASDALATKSKDLQLAAWLTEALVKREGIAGLRQGLELIRSLLEAFWDTLHPELEEGDAEMRAGILDWIGSKLDQGVKSTPLTRGGLSWFDYKESRAIGYEADCAGSEARTTARAAAIEARKPAAEDFDRDFNSTPKSFYESLFAELEASLAAVRSLDAFGEEKFGDTAPSFSLLRSALEEVQQIVRLLFDRKRAAEPAPAQPGEPVEEQSSEAPVAEEGAGQAPAVETRRAAVSARKVVASEPADRDDAIGRVIVAARYLRREEPYSPVPYLMLRALRWGELRASGADPNQLEAPPTQLRQQLKRLSLEGSWQEVLETAETAMESPCGRGWLDVQRFAVRACTELGSWHEPVANAIRSELRALLADFPALSEMTLLDDTPAANNETQAWLRESIPPAAEPGPAPVFVAAGPPPASAEAAPPDSYSLALEAVRRGRKEEAIGLLMRETSQERAGRGRFLRRVQLAQVCLLCGKEFIAYPILRDLAAEIEHRRLEEWEAPDVLAQPLVFLFRCMTKLKESAEEKQRVYERICRLDPVQAMACAE